MTAQYDPVEATQPTPPTSIRDNASQQAGAGSFISASSNANTSAATDAQTSSTSAERKGDTIPAPAESEGEVRQEVVQEGKEDVGVGEGGLVQVD
ncbi:hypothetical protein OC835_001438 [Tilletia horrida]|uniref:Uncharacterized protein n=1 Tax=Tilletia horrida TaxID=155126 RepID=A0AAN6JMS5_9BASI|nr:hypothetical protein OC835_001438 [Tilletia horrida]KAK0540499.1 hypothetical protein OC842_000434 [Tilletia horrida]KAK0567006.1 hypothetical protein OC844_000440 [Tilletia horrida]